MPLWKPSYMRLSFGTPPTYTSGTSLSSSTSSLTPRADPSPSHASPHLSPLPKRRRFGRHDPPTWRARERQPPTTLQPATSSQRSSPTLPRMRRSKRRRRPSSANTSTTPYEGPPSRLTQWELTRRSRCHKAPPRENERRLRTRRTQTPPLTVRRRAPQPWRTPPSKTRRRPQPTRSCNPHHYNSGRRHASLSSPNPCSRSLTSWS